MKKPISLAVIPALLASLCFPVLAAADSAAAQNATTRQAMMLLFMLSAVLVLACVIYTAVLISTKLRGNAQGYPQKLSRDKIVLAVAFYATALIVIGITFYCYGQYTAVINAPVEEPTATTTQAPETEPSTAPTTAPTTQPTTEPTTVPTTEATEPPTTEDPRLNFSAVSTAEGDPSNWGVTWKIIVNGEVTDSYVREEAITFGDGSEYFALPGIATFRGNNYRNTSTYGTAEVNNVTLTKVWSRPIGSYNDWSGSGWTGQPLIVQWDEETKQIMNLYDSKKQKEDLVEVIYATLDGYIYFYDLDDGSYTRDPIWMGMNFKGAGAVDPRGYPLLYVGGGIRVNGGNPSMYVVSLIDGTILYKNGSYDAYDLRGWVAYDSSPLVDAETDTLIWPGESGILYTIKLNTQYDKEAGTITVDPDSPVKTQYTTTKSRAGRYLGYEDSVSVVDHWMYVSENGGMFFCIDLNTMELVWAQDTLDDSNSSPVFEWDDEGNGYIYTAPSLHWTASGGSGYISIYKLDASTGEILWEVPFACKTITDLSGGVQSTPLLGREGTEIEGLIIYAIARCPDYYSGQLVALDTETGEIVWQSSTGNYCWSSPTAFYTEDGEAYVFVCDVDGDAKLYDGATGERLTTISLGSTTEASPVVFNDTLIIGTRAGNVYCIKIS